MMTKDEVKKRIMSSVQCDYIDVQGDDGRHFNATIVSKEFDGIGMLKQHKLIYSALGDAMKNDEIHALSLKTYTPEAWERNHAK